MPKNNLKRDSNRAPPFETDRLRKGLTAFLNKEFIDPLTGTSLKVGNFKWGVYAFFDYDGEPIYVGQTNEMLRTRIRRHLTNQRTDAVAMSVLDPFEVFEIEVWPLPHLQNVDKKAPEAWQAKEQLNSLEALVYENALQKSQFNAVLNEKNPPTPNVKISLPSSIRDRIVFSDVLAIRSHPDIRIARRALTIARLAQVIAERQVQDGLRRVLVVQAQRLQSLARRRYEALGGPALVEQETEEDDT